MESLRSTTLRARVWHRNTDVTDTVPASRFIWTRHSTDAMADSVWNEGHIGFKTILVTTADVLHQATFQCDLLQD